MNFKKELVERAADIEEVIYGFFPVEEAYQATVIEAMNYTMKAGGKRLRPMLMSETYKLFGGDQKVIEPFMAAIEMIHTYSLIHDDLPALDNDDYRRGRETAHKVFGEDMAILAGDALLNYAFETASKAFDYEENNDLKPIAKAMQVLAHKPGIYGMLGGQVADVGLTGKEITMDQLAFIHRCKTGALIEASMMIGAILANADDANIQAVEQIASDIGMAFQIEDDILDVTGTEEELGKPVNSDERNGKITYVTLKGLAQAREDAQILSDQAIRNLEALPGTNDFLKELVLYLVNRQN